MKKKRSDRIRESRETLPLVFWGFFIGSNLILKIPFLFVETNLAIKSWFFVWLIWNIFVIFLVFETADKYKREKVVKGLGYGWATTAKISCVLLFLSAIGNAL